MESGEYGLTRGTRVVARRPVLVAVAGLLWILWCVLGAADFWCYLILILFCVERTRPAATVRPPFLIYLSTSNGVCVRTYRIPLFSWYVC